MSTGLASRLPSLDSPSFLTVALVAAVGLVAGTVSWLMEYGSYDSFAAILVLIALIVISAPLMRRAMRIESDPRIARLLWIALGCKLLAAVVRFAISFGLYDGNADASTYHEAGAVLARQFRAGDLVVDLGRPVQGTGFIQLLTGWIYTLTGATDLGGFFVFAWLGFWGLYFFHRAFSVAVPQGDHFRYAVLVFLLPSLLFWPSSIGKEAWMCLGLGVCAYGAARVLTGARLGLVVFVMGLVGLAFVRPHVAALAAAALPTAYLLRSQRGNRSGLAPFGKLIGLVVLGAMLVVAVGQLESYLGVDAFDSESVQLTLDEVTHQTGQGGSYISGTQGSLSPTRFPVAFVNVVFRPFPWQATNPQSLLASVEAMVLLVLFATSWRRIVAALRSVFHTPYVVFCLCYSALFVYGFSSFANFGILVRQRVQVLPFLLVLLAFPPHRAAPRDADLASSRLPGRGRRSKQLSSIDRPGF